MALKRICGERERESWGSHGRMAVNMACVCVYVCVCYFMTESWPVVVGYDSVILDLLLVMVVIAKFLTVSMSSLPVDCTWCPTPPLPRRCATSMSPVSRLIQLDVWFNFFREWVSYTQCLVPFDTSRGMETLRDMAASSWEPLTYTN